MLHMSLNFSMTNNYSLTLTENEGNYQVMLTTQDQIMYEALDKALKTVKILNNHIEPKIIFQYHQSILQQPETYSNNKMPNLETILRQ